MIVQTVLLVGCLLLLMERLPLGLIVLTFVPLMVSL